MNLLITVIPLHLLCVAPTLIAILQVTETIKLLARFGCLLTGKMLYVGGDTIDFVFHNLAKKPNCNVCEMEVQSECKDET